MKGVTHDEILTKKEGSNVKIVNSNIRLYNDSEPRIWWIEWRQWFGWEEWACSKWRDKVDIARETEDEEEITNTGNFGTHRFGGGGCRSVICTLREKCMEYQLNKY